ncbi:hypothetical protein Q8A73_013833 [Channa argus]|nr:hypothetical protein Q8A73_013833 [Channa argus]
MCLAELGAQIQLGRVSRRTLRLGGRKRIPLSLMIEGEGAAGAAVCPCAVAPSPGTSPLHFPNTVSQAPPLPSLFNSIKAKGQQPSVCAPGESPCDPAWHACAVTAWVSNVVALGYRLQFREKVTALHDNSRVPDNAEAVQQEQIDTLLSRGATQVVPQTRDDIRLRRRSTNSQCCRSVSRLLSRRPCLLDVRILAYLDDWALVASSREQAVRQSSLVLSYIQALGFSVNAQKSSPQIFVSRFGDLFRHQPSVSVEAQNCFIVASLSFDWDTNCL